MKNLFLSTFAAAAIGGLSMGAASAMPFNSGLSAAGVNSGLPAAGESLVHQARVVCQRNGRCYNTNRRARVSQRYYAPRAHRYNRSYGYNRGYAQPYYGAYGGPAIGIGVGPFGIGVF